MAAHIEWFCIVWHTGPLSDTLLGLIPADPQWVPVRVARVADPADLAAPVRQARADDVAVLIPANPEDDSALPDP